MELTTEGFKVSASMEGIENNEFLVKLHINYSPPTQALRNAQRQMQNEGVIGSKLNAHEANYADAKAAISTAYTEAQTAISDFITTYNANQSS